MPGSSSCPRPASVPASQPCRSVSWNATVTRGVRLVPLMPEEGRQLARCPSTHVTPGRSCAGLPRQRPVATSQAPGTRPRRQQHPCSAACVAPKPDLRSAAWILQAETALLCCRINFRQRKRQCDGRAVCSAFACTGGNHGCATAGISRRRTAGMATAPLDP